MKKMRLPLLTVLLTIALIGLITLQLYWTNMAYQIARQRFKQATHEALQAVAQKLEQREIIYATQRSASKLQDSLRHWGQQHMAYQKMRLEQMHALKIEKTNPNIGNIEELYSNQTSIVHTFRHKKNAFYPRYKITTCNPTDLRTSIDASPAFIEALPQKKIIKIESQEDVLKFLMQEIRQTKLDIEKRIHKKLIDSLLKKEFMERGIYLPYAFGVEVLPRNNTLPTHSLTNDNQQVNQDIAQLTNLNDYAKPRYLFFATPKEKRIVLQSTFHVQLFPTEIVGNRNTLFVYFPQEIDWLWREMAFTGSASVLFIALIIGCFAYTFYTIWKQKKISEVTNDFINNMTHEFKTPIATVSLACEALQDPDMRQVPQYTDRYLQIIKEENERLGRQVERVLQIAVLDRTDFRLKLQTCNIHEILKKALHNISLQIESRQGIITTSLQATQTEIKADEVHIINLILNLLDNALKYSPENPNIKVSTHNESDGILLAVSDKGQGMSKESQSKVFDKFYRVSTGNLHNVKGFGLGLSYVRTVALAHHGRVSVQSEIGKGSTFSVFLPFQQA